MTCPASSPAPRTFALSKWDLASSFTNIPFIYYFKNNGDVGAAGFMPADTMRASFLLAVQEFPILAGHLVVNRDGSAHILADSGNLNMPDYRESSASVHYADIERAAFSWDALPPGVPTVGALTTAEADGTVRLAHVHIVRLKDDSGLVLFVSLSHYVVDGVGYCAFVNRWSEICRWMCRGLPAEGLPERSYSFDRMDLARNLPPSTADLSGVLRRIYASPNCTGRVLAWMSPGARGATLVAFNALARTKSHIFHITRSSIAALRKSTHEYAGQAQRISDNDILTALVSHTVAAAMQSNANASWVSRTLSSAARKALRVMAGVSDEFATFLVLDIRPRVKILARERAAYTGNCVVCIPIVRPMEQAAPAEVTPATLAETCARVRAAVDGTDDQTIGALAAAMDKSAASYAHILVNGMLYPRKIVLSNQSRFTLYQNDFGAGIPEMVCPLPTFYANFASVLPAHPSADGYNIYMTLDPNVLERVTQDDLWNAHTTPLVF
ncbi:hypothetical protein LPJ61_000500 [Coemansia biformis]|uniref:Transferase n=1 Tax=Coemansia biformis TaxID=1286918 RepID=A0A9W7YBN2_9FUNG|nr:hypothetical protein LPJ61_000500 [Coemansia biformis]